MSFHKPQQIMDARHTAGLNATPIKKEGENKKAQEGPKEETTTRAK